MIGTLQCVVLDCPSPTKLAEFYRALLGGTVNKPDRRWSLDGGWTTLHLDSGAVLAFQRAADYQPPDWPDPRRPQQLHLDVDVQDLDAAEHAALALGAVVLDSGDGRRRFRVYADPAGHPFCLVQR